ncbi:hypothetical protein D3OALGA1CA_945 [Olavius algarvensis associated proteobacterium Delta 3]|nr:hypothetical protein D3OALGA1CA_945 [Olavius algarvensis associated proteobacterium Delta 3]CAB5129645.1 hypothetical protein D3OALGB2SA_3532 [Olavius algarvensis associated proteobacterium Delta 3]
MVLPLFFCRSLSDFSILFEIFDKTFSGTFEDRRFTEAYVVFARRDHTGEPLPSQPFPDIFGPRWFHH